MPRKKRNDVYNYGIQQMKSSIADQLGIKLGAENTARNNGHVGGQMTKNLVQFAQQMLQQKSTMKY